MNINIYLLTFLLFAFICASLTRAAATHKHHVHAGNKERTEDGHGGFHGDKWDEHESIIGSIKEAEEFDSLQPEESKKRLAILITKMDTNNDKFIDRHELKAWILRSFKMLGEEEANDRFEDTDENSDELVSWQEYLNYTYGMDSEEDTRDPLNAPHASEEAKLIADDKEMFDASDLNKDGVLNVDEFVVFLNPEEHPQMLPVILKQTLTDKDKNHDGKIDFQEFIGESATHHDKEWLVSEKDKFDNDFDRNGDGVLNDNEILSWVVPSNDEVANDEVNHLFATADDDTDDRLSYQEILDNHETFVGSEATDYGDQLRNIHHYSDEL